MSNYFRVPTTAGARLPTCRGSWTPDGRNITLTFPWRSWLWHRTLENRRRRRHCDIYPWPAINMRNKLAQAVFTKDQVGPHPNPSEHWAKHSSPACKEACKEQPLPRKHPTIELNWGNRPCKITLMKDITPDNCVSYSFPTSISTWWQIKNIQKKYFPYCFCFKNLNQCREKTSKWSLRLYIISTSERLVK